MNITRILATVLLFGCAASMASAQRLVLDPKKLLQSAVWASAMGKLTGGEETTQDQEKSKQAANDALAQAFGDSVSAQPGKPLDLNTLTPEQQQARQQLIDALKNADNPSVDTLRDAFKSDNDFKKSLTLFTTRLNDIEQRNGQKLAFNERLALEEEMGVYQNQTLLLTLKTQQDKAEERERLRAEKIEIRSERERLDLMSAGVEQASR